jgi:hypothetical protein
MDYREYLNSCFFLRFKFRMRDDASVQGIKNLRAQKKFIKIITFTSFKNTSEHLIKKKPIKFKIDI